MALKLSDTDALFGDLNVPTVGDKAPQNTIKTPSKPTEEAVPEPAVKEPEEVVVPVSPLTKLPEHAEVKTVAKKHRQNLYFTQEIADYINYEARRRGMTINRFVESVLNDYMNSKFAYISDEEIRKG